MEFLRLVSKHWHCQIALGPFCVDDLNNRFTKYGVIMADSKTGYAGIRSVDDQGGHESEWIVPRCKWQGGLALS